MIVKSLFFIVFILFSDYSTATTIGNTETFREEDGKFVFYPARVGTVVGGIVGGIIGVPVAIVSGAASVFTDVTVSDAVSFGFVLPIAFFAYAGNAAFGAPFWGVKQLCCSKPPESQSQQEKELESE
tara:strand:- start:156 stop:536 length:381 start_codon:yes stop_codon:yes gene_type:complete